MLSFSEIAVLLLICAVTGYFWGQMRPNKNYPPGPWGFPFVGHLPLLIKNTFKTQLKWKKTYGPVIGLVFGSYRVVVINDYKMIKEAMQEERFSGRPRLRPVCDRSGGEPKGLAFTDGHEWIEKRRFTLKHLRDFGFGKQSMESIVQDEIVELIEHFKKDVGKPTRTMNRFNAAILNALWTVISGQRFKQDDLKLLEILKLVNQAFPESNSPATLSTLVPILSRIAPNLMGFNGMMSKAFQIVDYIKSFVQSHKESHINGSPRGFLDVYLDKIEQSEPGSGFYGKEGEHSMLFVLVDLFSAGAETTSTTLTNIFLYMALHQDKQKKLHAEIDRVIGSSRLACLSDRPNMVYTESVINEVLRMCPLISIMHRAKEPMEFYGFSIPKDTIIMPDTYSAHFDPDFWKNPGPEIFHPERFIDQDGKSIKKFDAFMPFGLGKRICPAETLARDELFLFIACLFQKFSVNVDPSRPLPSTELIIKTVISPKPHLVILSER